MLHRSAVLFVQTLLTAAKRGASETPESCLVTRLSRTQALEDQLQELQECAAAVLAAGLGGGGDQPGDVRCTLLTLLNYLPHTGPCAHCPLVLVSAVSSCQRCSMRELSVAAHPL